jgi:hypothetical protein
MHSVCSCLWHVGQVQQSSSWTSYWQIMHCSCGCVVGGGGGCVDATSTLTNGCGSGFNDGPMMKVFENLPSEVNFEGAFFIVSVASFTSASMSSLKSRSSDAALAAAFRPQRTSFSRFEPLATHCRSSSVRVTMASKDADGNRSVA